ncbi:hypothetical protein [Streptomyces sp. NBC_01602]|uniref:hypothetical protein n=1 Tax=Streptomyces sp. NBC_01602 TaxID=2975893 RepID=UPI0038688459
MTGEVATIAAAAIAATGALVGVFSGIIVGRRQVTDQASVEHGQWLRGQRQEAYTVFLAAWDAGIWEFGELIREPYDLIHAAEIYEGDGFEEMQKHLYEKSFLTWQSMQRPLERVQLLGPASVDEACTSLAAAADALETAVRVSSGTPEWPDYSAIGDAHDLAQGAREQFLKASRQAMRTPPHPGR